MSLARLILTLAVALALITACAPQQGNDGAQAPAADATSTPAPASPTPEPTPAAAEATPTPEPTATEPPQPTPTNTPAPPPTDTPAPTSTPPTESTPTPEPEPEQPIAAQAAPADEATERIVLPEGFHINVFAEGLPGARFMAFGPDGGLYVSLMGRGQIAMMRDDNADGIADGVQIVAADLSLPHGLEWRDGWLYVAQGNRVERLQDSDGDGILDARELITDNIPPPAGHRTRTLRFGPDGYLYVAAGSSCNICVEDDPRRAAIMRFNADGSIPEDNPLADDPDPRRQALWAWGLRNVVDFTWTPDGEMWGTAMGSDGLGDHLPPEQVVVPVRRGEHHGWPFCYTPELGPNLPPDQRQQVRDTRMALPEGFDCSQAVPSLFNDPAHAAPLGMTWGTGAAFPEEYQDDLYIAYHGSWNTSIENARDPKVRRIIVEDGLPVAAEDFANGWRPSGVLAGHPDTWGRPADVIIGPDGAMYVSDDHGNRIYRIVWTG